MQPTSGVLRERPKRKIIKATLDVLLITGLVVMSVTGIGLYFAPSGRIAREIHWSWLGMDKWTLGDFHAYFGFAMLIVALLHLSLNWKPLKSLLMTLNGSDAIKLMAVVLILLGGVIIYAWGWLKI